MSRFRKLPVEIDAVQWDGEEETLKEILRLVPRKEDGTFDLPSDGQYVNSGIAHLPARGELEIPTLEGTMTASVGDWIIRGVAGEVYPCKPEIFEATYEAVE